jgi:outer membrane protein assembly factor BamB
MRGVPVLCLATALVVAAIACFDGIVGDPAGGGTPGNGDGGVDGGSDGGPGGVDGGGGTDGGGGSDGGLAITTFGADNRRDGVFVDGAFTRARLQAIVAAGGLKPDPAFAPAIQGRVYASPLFVEGGVNGKDAVFVATEQNHVYAIDPVTGTILWDTNLGRPVPLSQLGCGNIDPMGVTGTPVIDVARGLMVLDAEIDQSISGPPHHTLFGLALSTGAVAWSIDIDANVSGFDTTYQGQRSGLLLLGDTAYVPYGGYFGDCGTNWGWVMGVPLATPTASALFHYRTPGQGGAIWSPAGIASDGVSIFAVTGNGEGSQPTWASGDSDALLRLSSSLVFSGNSTDYFAFHDWQGVSAADGDLGSNGTVLFDLPGAGSGHLALVIGKSRNAWLLDRDNLGGINNPDHPLAELDGIATDDASGSMATYQAPSGRYVVYTAPCPNGNGLGLLKINPGNPPTITQPVPCLDQGANGTDQGGAPIVTTPDGTTDFVIWGTGAGGDSQLHAFDGETGAVLLSSSGASGAIHWVAPLVAKGTIYLPGNSTVYAFRVR